MTLLPSCYNPPIDYFKDVKIVDDNILLDKHEYFIKQTVRSRCHILSSNGIQSLIVPIVHNNRNRVSMKDILISDAEKWQDHHWKSIKTAYNSSAFFEFYQDDFHPLYKKRFKFLFDLNMELLMLILSSLNMQVTELNFTPNWIKEHSNSDLREKYSTGSPVGRCPKYPQVFSYKFGFTAGLSILDLLFNTGPQAHSHIVASGIN